MQRAIDIVLIPPESIVDTVVAINQKASDEGKAVIRLYKEQRIPHLSLLMGVLEDKDMPFVKEKLLSLATQYPPLNLTIDAVEKNSFVIQRGPELQELHERIIRDVDPLLTHSSIASMYCEPDGYTLYDNFSYWVNNFVSSHSIEKFWPHISVHVSGPYPVRLPIIFQAKRLAVCHLGDHNTCKEILYEIQLEAT